jgi:hypothetical protein
MGKRRQNKNRRWFREQNGGGSVVQVVNDNVMK